MNTERIVTEVKPEITYAVWILADTASRSSGVWATALGISLAMSSVPGYPIIWHMAIPTERFLLPTIFQAGVT